MMRLIASLSMLVLVMNAWAQDEPKDVKKADEKKDEDKIGKSKAPEALKKSAAELSKKKGYHATEKVTTPALGPGGGQGQEPTFEGVVLKDAAAMKGSAPVYAKGALVLVKNTKGEYVTPDTLNDQEAAIVAGFKNPAVLLAEVTRFSGTSAYDSDEAIDGQDCKVAFTSADEKTMLEQVKTVSGNIPQLKRFGVRDISGFMDKKNSSSDYRIWIGKQTLLPYKVEWKLTIAIDKDKIPGGFGQGMPDKIEAVCEVQISQYDEKLDVEWPKEIKAKFGIK